LLVLVAKQLKNHFLFSRFNEGTYLKDSRFTDGGGSKKILANIEDKESFSGLETGVEPHRLELEEEFG
jgi:hypothetical protein